MESYYWAALQTISGLGNSSIRTLVAFFGSAQQVWLAHRRDLLESGCLSSNNCNNLLAEREKIDVHKFAATLVAKGIKLTCFADADYPPLLANIANSPVVLYYRGQLPSDKLLIAIVGARSASTYGRNAATMLAAGLAAANIGVVSGAARGIDTAAHQGALSEQGYTLAVLACGVDICYPPENAKLLASIAEQGAVVSEYAPGTSPLPKFFPIRNRIISGLARGIIIVEAAEKSGSLITADWALEQGRDVFAVPGSIFSATSRGTHKLIKFGAKPVETVADILEEYSLCPVKPKCISASMLNEEDTLVYNALNFDNPLGMEEINMMTKLPPQVISYTLLQLELKGLISQFNGQRYARIPGRDFVE